MFDVNSLLLLNFPHIYVLFYSLTDTTLILTVITEFTHLYHVLHTMLFVPKTKNTDDEDGDNNIYLDDSTQTQLLYRRDKTTGAIVLITAIDYRKVRTIFTHLKLWIATQI